MATRAEALNEAVKAQWAKLDAAIAAGLRGAPLVRLDQKLVRLERERDEAIEAERRSVSNFKPNGKGVCQQCGRDIGWHAGTRCYPPDATGMPKGVK